MTHTPRHKAQSSRKQYTGSSKYNSKKATYSPEGFVDRPTLKKPKPNVAHLPPRETSYGLDDKYRGTTVAKSTYVPPRSLPPQEAMPTFDPNVSGVPAQDIRWQPPRHVADSGAFTVSQQERDRAAPTIAAQEVAQIKAQREAEAKAVIAAAARDYHTRTQAAHYDTRQLKYQQYGDDRGAVVGRNVPMQGVQDAGADRKFQTTSQRLPTGGYIRQTLGPGSTLWYEKDTDRTQTAADSVGFWNAVADRASDPAESYYRNNLADAVADKWEQIRNRQDMDIAEPNDSLIMNSLEKFYKETEHGLTPDDIGFEIIIPDDKVDTQDDPDSTVVVPTTITTTPPPGGGGAGDAGGGGWDWGGYGSGGYGNYGGNVYNITYGNRGYEQRIDPWAYGMVQWRI